MTEQRTVADMIEPEAVASNGVGRELIMFASIAISLKRIADTICTPRCYVSGDIDLSDLKAFRPGSLRVHPVDPGPWVPPSAKDEFDPKCPEAAAHTPGTPCFSCWIPF